MGKLLKYKVLITASGIGSRLGEITRYTNKAMVRIGEKPAISYIIESYPKDTEFVITLGYFGKQIKDFLSIAYKDRSFEYVEIDKYNGQGSNLVYSILKASPFLQCPFIFNACDTIVMEPVPKPVNNWIGGYVGKESANYRSFSVLNGRVQKLYEKGVLYPDYLHIGLVGINDYKNFWQILEKIYKEEKYNQQLSDVHVLSNMISNNINFKIKEFKTWIDTGNAISLCKAREKMKDSFNVLDKADESIFILNKYVIKFFFNKKLVEDRIKRSEILKGLVPKIEDHNENFYKYKYVKGEVYADVANSKNFSVFLNWAEKKLWKKVKEVSDKDFSSICKKFYYDKTIDRVMKFMKTRNINDSINYINGEKIPSLKEIIKQVDFEWLSRGEQRRIHGDFILDNIIKTKKGYVLLDWRQDFGGLLKSGDVYYDLSKLNHNLTLNHELILKNYFKINVSDENVKIDVLRRQTLIDCQKELFKFLKTSGYDSNKVKMLTSIVWLNMSPLHHSPFDIFLYYFGKLNLWRSINEKN